MRRVIGVLRHPRRTMADVVARPTFAAAWVFLLAVLAVCAFALLSTAVGRQALVDERVRVTEAFGGRVNDAAYAALQANPPLLVYLTSGGRLLLTPGITLLVAAGLITLAALDGVKVRYGVALAITVYASLVLALQQVVVALAQLVVQTAEATEGQAVQVALLILLIAVAEAVRVQHTVLLAQAGAVAVVLVVRILPTEATARRTQAVAVAGVEATQHRQAGKAEAEL